MKLSFYLPLVTIFIVLILNGCGPSAEEIAEQIRIKDSIEVAKLDSIKTAQKVSELQAKYIAIDSSKNQLQKKFDDALTKHDSLTGYSTGFNQKLEPKISKVKLEISSILKKQKLTPEEESKAQNLIIELNDLLIKLSAKK